MQVKSPLEFCWVVFPKFFSLISCITVIFFDCLSLETSLWRPLCKKGVCRFFGRFSIFCRIELIFHRLTCFWHETHRSVIITLWSICPSFSRNNVCKKTQLCVKRQLYEQIFWRQISMRPELKRLLLAASTVLVCEIARETEKKKKKKKKEEAMDFVSNPCHDKTNPDPLRSAP